MSQRNPEIHHLYRSVILYHNILRFDIAMDNIILMGMFNSGCQLFHNIDGFFLMQSSPLGKKLFQRLTAYVFHNDIMFVLVFTYIIYIDDIRMIQLAGGICLSLKTHQCDRIAAKLATQYFNGDFAVQDRIHGQINVRHTAFSQIIQDFIAVGYHLNHAVHLLPSPEE